MIAAMVATTFMNATVSLHEGRPAGDHRPDLPQRHQPGRQALRRGRLRAGEWALHPSNALRLGQLRHSWGVTLVDAERPRPSRGRGHLPSAARFSVPTTESFVEGLD